MQYFLKFYFYFLVLLDIEFCEAGTTK